MVNVNIIRVIGPRDMQDCVLFTINVTSKVTVRKQMFRQSNCYPDKPTTLMKTIFPYYWIRGGRGNEKRKANVYAHASTPHF